MSGKAKTWETGKGEKIGRKGSEGRVKQTVRCSSTLTKLVLTLLLISSSLVASAYLVDFQQTHLARLATSLPPEVQQVAAQADQLLNRLAVNVKTNLAAAKTKIEELTRTVELGSKGNLGEILFGTSEHNTAQGQVAKTPSEEASALKLKAKAEAEKAAAKKATAEKIASENAAAEKVAAEEKAAAEKATADKVDAEKKAEDIATAEKITAEKITAEKMAAEKKAAEKAKAENVAAEKMDAEKKAAEKTIADMAEAEKAAADSAAAEERAPQRTAAENAAAKKDAALKDNADQAAAAAVTEKVSTE